jgi:hypothetical protein
MKAIGPGAQAAGLAKLEVGVGVSLLSITMAQPRNVPAGIRRRLAIRLGVAGYGSGSANGIFNYCSCFVWKV